MTSCAPPSNGTATGSCTRRPSADSSTRPRCSWRPKATTTGCGSPTPSTSRRSPAPPRARSDLNEDLTEAIALGHDLGHTPFGHLGEQALTPFLGRPFKHNEESLRIVEFLENDGQGLNLTWEVRDGIVHHPWSMPPPATLEAQVVRFADRIAYLNHDVDDAIRAGVLQAEELPADALDVLGRTHSARIDRS